MKTYCTSYLGCTITLTCEKLGCDLLISCTGGDKPHVGAISLAQPYAAADGHTTACSSSISAFAHREAQLSDKLASMAAKCTGCNAAVVCGIHFNSITPQRLEHLMQLCLELCSQAMEDIAE